MTDLNGRRLLTAGVVTGLVLNAGYALAEQIQRAELELMLARLSLTAPAEATMLVIAAAGMLVGLVLVWLYAVMLRTYGAGMATAARAAAAVWTLACLVPNLSLLVFGIISATHFWLASAGDLVVVTLAALAGARVYGAQRTLAGEALPIP